MMDDVVAEIVQDLKDQLAEMSTEERKEVFDDLLEDYCVRCGGESNCYCSPMYDE
jgi:hypothetical protein